MALSWGDLQFFLSLCRTGSLTASAKDLRVNPTTVGRRIAAFEQQVGTPLLMREGGKFVVTATGKAVLEHAEQMAQHADFAENQILGAANRLEGRVRIATTTEFATGFLLKPLAQLRESHPEIKVELITDADRVDLAKGEADIALRFNSLGASIPIQSNEQDVLVQRIGTIGISAFASLEYLEKHGTPERADSFSGHHLIEIGSNAVGGLSRAWLTPLEHKNKVSVVVQNLSEAASATAAGLGICVLPVFMAPQHPNLRRLAPPASIKSIETWIMVPAAVRRVARVRLVQKFLADLIEDSQVFLSGRVAAELEDSAPNEALRH